MISKLAFRFWIETGKFLLFLGAVIDIALCFSLSMAKQTAIEAGEVTEEDLRRMEMDSAIFDKFFENQIK